MQPMRSPGCGGRNVWHRPRPPSGSEPAWKPQVWRGSSNLSFPQAMCRTASLRPIYSCTRQHGWACSRPTVSYDGDRVCRREPCGLPARRGAQIRGSADDRRRPATSKERRCCAPWMVGSTTALLLLPCCGLFRRLRRLLLVLVADFVKADVNDISVDFRPRRQRKRQALLDIDELNVCLGRRNDDR